jgi:uncharacterized protein
LVGSASSRSSSSPGDAGARESKSVATLVAREVPLPQPAVGRTLQLLDGGATVPFIARYRKEATEGLDDARPRAGIHQDAHGQLRRRRRPGSAHVARLELERDDALPAAGSDAARSIG